MFTDNEEDENVTLLMSMGFPDKVKEISFSLLSVVKHCNVSRRKSKKL